VKSQDNNSMNGALDRKGLQFLIEAFLKQNNLSQMVNQNQAKQEDNSIQFESNKEKFIAELNK
jgi:hypothetical protein